MAITALGPANVTSSKSSGTSITLSATVDVLVGDLSVVVFGADDASGTYSCAVGTGTATVGGYQIDVARVINSGHCSLVIFSAIVTGAGSLAPAVTHPTLVARSVGHLEFRGTDTTASRVDGTPVTATGTGNAGSGNLTTVSSGSVMVGLSVYESDTSNTYSQDANFLPVIGQDSAGGTTGGGDASNISLVCGYELLSGTATDAYDTTNSASRNWAAALLAYKVAAAASTAIPYGRYVRQAVNRAASYCRPGKIWVPGWAS